MPRESQKVFWIRTLIFIFRIAVSTYLFFVIVDLVRPGYISRQFSPLLVLAVALVCVSLYAIVIGKDHASSDPIVDESQHSRWFMRIVVGTSIVLVPIHLITSAHALIVGAILVVLAFWFVTMCMLFLLRGEK